jgi:hypothetical protein
MISRRLTLQKLALDTIHGKEQAAQILGDALMERGEYSIATGRVRNVQFQASSPNPNIDAGGLVTPLDKYFGKPGGWSWAASMYSLHSFTVRGVETLHNVHHYAEHPNLERWNQIFTMVITTKRDIYRAMIAQGILAKGVSFRKLYWESGTGRGSSTSWKIFVNNGITRYLFRVTRHDNAKTDDVYFRNVKRVEGDPRRRRRKKKLTRKRSRFARSVKPARFVKRRS